ncbi:hypothetical protein WN944_014944 [Citrus x changshan-huyou]|uniref:Ubiquitin-like protease family profile domain-containing protein n=1 Tax=Citrus x changshan-huyou TaxID=2935761 RepID=A0AAP0MAT1_9ROSI
MDNQLRKRKRESINLQKSSTCLPKVNNENAVPKSSTYGFVSHFCSDEEELLRSHNFNLSTTIGVNVMGVKDGGIPIQLGGPSENIAELRDIFQSTVKGINIKTLEDIIKQEDKTSWIFKIQMRTIDTDNIKTPSHEFVSAQENNVGDEFIEISSNESSARGYDKINSPYDGSSLNTEERQLYQILRTLEMAMDCEKTDALPSKKMEMSKGKQELILKDSKEGLVMIQSTAKGMHIQTSKEKNVNLKSTQPRFLAGPFSIPTPFTEDEKKLILYLFDDKLAEMYGLIITMYAEYKTIEEAQKDITSPRCWFLPSYYSQVVLGDSGDLNPYRRASRFQERYMPQLETCEKIYVPIHCEAHWYMLVIDILRQTADIWDSLESLSQREKMINQSLTILASLDFLLLREARLRFGSNFNFLHFQLGRQTGLPQQPNDFDGGYYTLKYMDNPSIVADQSYQHDSDYARILLALYLAQSPLNDIRHKLMQDASNGYGKCSAADSQRAPCKQTSELRKAARNINLNQTPSEALLKTLL